MKQDHNSHWWQHHSCLSNEMECVINTHIYLRDTGLGSCTWNSQDGVCCKHNIYMFANLCHAPPQRCIIATVSAWHTVVCRTVAELGLSLKRKYLSSLNCLHFLYYKFSTCSSLCYVGVMFGRFFLLTLIICSGTKAPRDADTTGVMRRAILHMGVHKLGLRMSVQEYGGDLRMSFLVRNGRRSWSIPYFLGKLVSAVLRAKCATFMQVFDSLQCMWMYIPSHRTPLNGCSMCFFR